MCACVCMTVCLSVCLVLLQVRSSVAENSENELQCFGPPCPFPPILAQFPASPLKYSQLFIDSINCFLLLKIVIDIDG